MASLTPEDCWKLYARGLMSKDELEGCISHMRPNSGKLQDLSEYDADNLKMDAYWIIGNNPLDTSPVTGRDPEVPYTYDTVGIPQDVSKMSVSGREAENEYIRQKRDPPMRGGDGAGRFYFAVAALLALGYVVGRRAHKP